MTSETYERLKVSVEGPLARITLAAPERRNAVDMRFAKEFASVCAACRQNKDIKLVLIRGTGKLFSVGGDINEFAEHAHDIRVHVQAVADAFHQGLIDLTEAAAPVVVGVNGTVAGIALGLVLAADMAVASAGAKFATGYSQLGLTPDGGSSFFLPRLMGRQLAFDMLATGRTLTAEEALSHGLVARVVPEAAFDAQLEEIVAALLGSPQFLAPLKRLLAQSEEGSFNRQLASEATSIATLAESPHSKERVHAFAEGRRK